MILPPSPDQEGSVDGPDEKEKAVIQLNICGRCQTVMLNSVSSGIIKTPCGKILWKNPPPPTTREFTHSENQCQGAWSCSCNNTLDVVAVSCNVSPICLPAQRITELHSFQLQWFVESWSISSGEDFFFFFSLVLWVVLPNDTLLWGSVTMIRIIIVFTSMVAIPTGDAAWS